MGKMFDKIYEVALLDPRANRDAKAANDRVFTPGAFVVGVAVTDPILAARCAWNLDPQHTGSDRSTAAIEAALMSDLPPAGATLVTIAPTVDAFGAMAVWFMRCWEITSGPERGPGLGRSGIASWRSLSIRQRGSGCPAI
jgi:hypothetical protein